MKKGKVRIGTSGWFYGHWDSVFYPEDLQTKDLLPFYAQSFDTVEINTTFYHLPKEESVKNWHDRVGKGFVFSVKLSRYITHQKKLLCDKKSVQIFLKLMKPLKSKLGCILIQLPPSFGYDYVRLETFFEMLPKKKRFAVEFRNESWFTKDVMELLRKFHIALCISDIKKYPIAETITSDFVYIRLHGSQRAYKGEYGPKRLKPWLNKITKWANSGLDVYCYFDNDEKGYAIADAKLLKSLMGA